MSIEYKPLVFPEMHHCTGHADGVADRLRRLGDVVHHPAAETAGRRDADAENPDRLLVADLRDRRADLRRSDVNLG